MKKTLVTGATGFVGQQVIQSLNDHGLPWIAAVRKKSDLFPIEKQTIIGEINGKTSWAESLKDVDRVIHSAGRAHQNSGDYALEKRLHLETNFLGSEKLIQDSIIAKIKKVIYISTIKVLGDMGDKSGQAFSESDPVNPQDPYSESKAKAEESLSNQTKGTDTQCIILRPPLVYGLNAKGNFKQLLKMCASGIPLPLAGIQDNRRSLVYVKNLADGIKSCLLAESSGTQLFHVADERPVSTAELIDLLGKQFAQFKSFSFPPLFLGMALDLIRKSGEKERLLSSLVVNIGLIKTKLHWSPPYSIENGLSETAFLFDQTRRSTR